MRKVLAYAKILGMANRTATYVLIEDRLGKSFSRYVSAARKAGRSWNTIALEINQQTGIAVTSETLRTWFYEHSAKSTADQAEDAEVVA